MLSYLDTAIGFSVVMLVISLLITILTQMVSALVNHRGSNLRWGLKTLFANIDPQAFPELAAQADDVARQVLTHCLISDSWFSGNKIAQWLASKVPVLKILFDRFQMASAIRPSELADILAQIASTLPAPPPQPKPIPAAAQLRMDIEGLLAARNATAARNIELVAAAVAGAVPGRAAIPPIDTVPLLEDTVKTIRRSAGRMEAWFGSIMDRVSQKFAMYMRLWTVGFACVFALGTGLNTINLIAEIYKNGVLRDALVAAGQQMTTTAASALDPQNSLAAKYSAALVDALRGQSVPVPQPPPTITTTAGGVQWINGNVPDAQRPAVLAAFDAASSAATQKFLADNKETADKLVGITSQAGIQVLKFHWPPDFPKQPARSQLRYLLGVFLTAALLSMGAPFWFNALKSLANLRPILASKQQTEEAQAAPKA
jgi:hypothetical protein